MSTVQELINERNVPSPVKGIKTAEQFEAKKADIRKLLSQREYGDLPKKPDHMRVSKDGNPNANFAAGKAVREYLTFSFEMDGKEFSFPAVSVIPKGKKKCPAFVFMSFDGGEANKYMPTEEIVERGFALFTFCYNDVTRDNNNFKDGIAKHLVKSRRKGTASGKIMLWAWAAMRLMDYIETQADVIDLDNVAVIGHSRLGKTALVAGAYDERFKYVISNDSGCCGAALERGKVGERYDVITNSFPHWFCPNFNRDAQDGIEFPFDQNYLLSLSVPRRLIIGSAEDDVWSDPTSEFLALASVNEVYELYNKRGLARSDLVPKPKSVLKDGDSVYYVREGAHFLSRHDWNTYMDIIEEDLNP